MNGLLIRVGVDQSLGGGLWNAPIDARSNKFVYVSIPETKTVREGMERPYSALNPLLSEFGVDLPNHLTRQHMHLDPDFDYLTYGDQGERAKQLLEKVKNTGDIIVFYAGLRDVRERRLIYAMIGLFFIDKITLATEISTLHLDTNAHSRRVLTRDSRDIVVHAQPKVSGKLHRCIPIGEWREGAYRVKRDILERWGGLSVKNGYLQRSARLPQILRPDMFLQWLYSQAPIITQANN